MLSMYFFSVYYDLTLLSLNLLTDLDKFCYRDRWNPAEGYKLANEATGHIYCS